MLLAARAEATASRQAIPHPRDCGAPRGQFPGRRPRSHLASPRRPHGLSPPRPGRGPRLGARGRPVPEQRGTIGGRARARARRRGPCAHPRHLEASWWSRRLETGQDEGAIFVSAPVPAGGTWTRVLSSDTASGLRRTICSRCRGAKTRSSTPFFGQRFIRVYDGVPGAKPGRSPAPFAALLGDLQDGVGHVAIGEADMAARHRERGRDPGVLSLRECHAPRRPYCS